MNLMRSVMVNVAVRIECRGGLPGARVIPARDGNAMTPGPETRSWKACGTRTRERRSVSSLFGLAPHPFSSWSNYYLPNYLLADYLLADYLLADYLLADLSQRRIYVVSSRCPLLQSPLEAALQHSVGAIKLLQY
jgi:hypothetical protein